MVSPLSIFLIIAPLIVVGDPVIQAAAQSGQNDAYAPLGAAPSAAFEVASIKKSSPNDRGSGLTLYPGARMVARGMTVRYLIAEAYRMDESQIVGGPAWIDKEEFHIEAKPPDSVASRYATQRKPTYQIPDEIRQMLQNLLADRFQLKVRVQEDKGRVYELVRNNHPLRLSPPKDESAFPWAGAVEGGVLDGKGLRGQNISMLELTRYLTNWLELPVVDRTGLQGPYDFLVHSESDDTGLALFDVVSQSLRKIGLELRKNTGNVYKLAVDQVSLPSSNQWHLIMLYRKGYRFTLPTNLLTSARVMAPGACRTNSTQAFYLGHHLVPMLWPYPSGVSSRDRHRLSLRTLLRNV
jgi:uncharacterized protein (TIGR03435 family)